MSAPRRRSSRFERASSVDVQPAATTPKADAARASNVVRFIASSRDGGRTKNTGARQRISAAGRVDASDPVRENQDEHDEEDQSESAARVVAPAAAVRPDRDRPEEEEDQEDDQ